MSMPSAAIACCTRASPPKLEISTSMPCFLKMPVRAPTSAGTNEKASRPALPMRKVSAEATGTASAVHSAAASSREANVIDASPWIF